VLLHQYQVLISRWELLKPEMEAEMEPEVEPEA
jgi:hypothetical protein